MAGRESTVTLKFNGARFRVAGKRIAEQADEAVKRAAFHVEAGFKQRAAVDTGFMRSSAYVVHSGGSTYQSAIQEATGRNEKATMLDEEEGPLPQGQAAIVVGAEYALFVELGGVNRPAQPALTPAFEEAREPFLADLRKIKP